MSVAIPAEPAEKAPRVERTGSLPAESATEPSSSWAARVWDGTLIVLFLGLTFLLGSFPLKDADIYWHLRTGDLIRETGSVPRTDIFTFTREGAPWIDLHWIFQVAISWLHERGGVPALNVAKCLVTCLAILILLSARKREWPIPVMVLAWLPALFVLSGRIYVRPETLTLFYLSVFLAVILRWDRFPALAFLLPVVQVAWVNSHGLFVLGPVILGFALIDAAFRFGLFAPERRRWWKLILGASLATLIACVLNPYGISGALYPIELAGTMSNPVFAKNVAELTSIPDFIKSPKSDGLRNLSLQLHLLTMLIGALSFLLPLVWWVVVSLRDGGVSRLAEAAFEPPAAAEKPSRGKKKRSQQKGAGGKTAKGAAAAKSASASDGGAQVGAFRLVVFMLKMLSPWRLALLVARVRPFRLLMFAAFSWLSLQATRNSHQFAAVVGTVTAWNFGEWVAAIRNRRRSQGDSVASRWSIPPRPLAFVAVASLLILVGSGRFFRMTGEGRTIGFGEDALWFPHEAVKFAGRPEMPNRFLSFHNGHAALYEYYHGPQRKVYIDPRLEVAGADLFRRYTALELRMKKNEPGWEAELAEMGRPVILSDHLHNAEIGATLLQSDHWRCVWFDAIATMFVHDSHGAVGRADVVDFADRHFRPRRTRQPTGRDELLASSKAIAKYLIHPGPSGGEKARSLAWLGVDATRELLRMAPDLVDGWINLGVIEFLRGYEPVARFRAAFDPVSDLSLVRATAALRRALELDPGNRAAASALIGAYDSRAMHEAALGFLHITDQSAKGPTRADYERKMGPRPAVEWRNLSELDQVVTSLLATGRVESAVVLLEKARAAERTTWDMADRIATLRLYLGEPARARAAWGNAVGVPQPALLEARIGTTYLAENDFNSARKHYRLALEAKPDLFEALYSLAILEADAGDAPTAFALARKAMTSAPDDASRAAARSLSNRLGRFARPVVELAGSDSR